MREWKSREVICLTANEKWRNHTFVCNLHDPRTYICECVFACKCECVCEYMSSMSDLFLSSLPNYFAKTCHKNARNFMFCCLICGFNQTHTSLISLMKNKRKKTEYHSWHGYYAREYHQHIVLTLVIVSRQNLLMDFDDMLLKTAIFRYQYHWKYAWKIDMWNCYCHSSTKKEHIQAKNQLTFVATLKSAYNLVEFIELTMGIAHNSPFPHRIESAKKGNPFLFSEMWINERNIYTRPLVYSDSAYAVEKTLFFYKYSNLYWTCCETETRQIACNSF